MSMTITTLRHHRAHLQNALKHAVEICWLEDIAEISEMERFALEQEDDLLFWELSQANEAIDFCHQLNIESELKRQRIANIACIRLGRFERKLKEVRRP